MKIIICMYSNMSDKDNKMVRDRYIWRRVLVKLCIYVKNKTATQHWPVALIVMRSVLYISHGHIKSGLQEKYNSTCGFFGLRKAG